MPVLSRRDAEKNRAYLTLAGLVGDEELREGVDRYLALLGGLAPGFTVVMDLSTCRPLSQAGVAELRRAVQASLARGLRASAQVVQQTTVALLQVQRVVREEHCPACTVFSPEEAARVLEEEPPGPARAAGAWH